MEKGAKQYLSAMSTNMLPLEAVQNMYTSREIHVNRH